MIELEERFNWQIFKIHDDLEKAYWQVFEDLFQLLFGKVDKVVTSQMLFDAGFDDTLPPVDDFF